MNTKTTTRAGRKIYYVAPGHVIDMATGMEWMRLADGDRRPGYRWFPRRGDMACESHTRLDRALASVARAEAVCALVRGMLGVAAVHVWGYQ